MIHASALHQIALALGVPPEGGCRCAVCGASPFPVAATLGQGSGANFSDYTLLADPGSDALCAGCVRVMAGRPGDGHRPKLGDVYYEQLSRVAHAAGYGHAKPVAWLACLLGNCAVPGRSVYDPYAGSGTTLLAGEAAGFAVIAVERDPALITLIRQRCAGAGLTVEALAA